MSTYRLINVFFAIGFIVIFIISILNLDIRDKEILKGVGPVILNKNKLIEELIKSVLKQDLHAIRKIFKMSLPHVVLNDFGNLVIGGVSIVAKPCKKGLWLLSGSFSAVFGRF